MSELLSICIPTYNRAEYLKELLAVLSEELLGLNDKMLVRIYVSDNASRDNTKAVVDEYAKKAPIAYYRNPENMGAVINIYKLLCYAQGKYIWIVGDDDLVKKGYLEKILNLLKIDTLGLLILAEDNYKNKIQIPAKFQNFHDFVDTISVVDPYMLIAHTLLSCNIFPKSCVDIKYVEGLMEKNIEDYQRNSYNHMYTIAHGLKNINAPVVVSNLNLLIVRHNNVPGLRPRAENTNPPLKNIRALWREYLCFIADYYSVPRLSDWAQKQYPKSQDAPMYVKYCVRMTWFYIKSIIKGRKIVWG